MIFVVILSLFVSLVRSDCITYMVTGDDHLDVDAVMSDPLVTKQYMDCFLDRADCEPLAQSYKVNMVEAVSTACYRCNEPLKHMWHRFLYILEHNYPCEYDNFKNKYDPENKYFDDFVREVYKY